VGALDRPAENPLASHLDRRFADSQSADAAFLHSPSMSIRQRILAATVRVSYGPCAGAAGGRLSARAPHWSHDRDAKATTFVRERLGSSAQRWSRSSRGPGHLDCLDGCIAPGCRPFSSSGNREYSRCAEIRGMCGRTARSRAKRGRQSSLKGALGGRASCSEDRMRSADISNPSSEEKAK
jgi:hypothetical protein